MISGLKAGLNLYWKKYLNLQKQLVKVRSKESENQKHLSMNLPAIGRAESAVNIGTFIKLKEKNLL